MRKKTKKPIIQLEEGWARISEGGLEAFIERVEAANDELESRPNPVAEMIKIIDDVTNMSLQRPPHNHGEALYKCVEDRTSVYFQEQFLGELAKAQQHSELAFLTEFASRWKQCRFTASGIRRMFDLDRWCGKNGWTPADDWLPVREKGFFLFKTIVFDHLKIDLRDAILGIIEDERNGNLVNRPLLADCSQIFIGLGTELETSYKETPLAIYTKDFQNDFIVGTGQYYQIASERWLDQKSTPEYLVAIDEIQVEEMSRVTSYLHEDTRGPLMNCLRETLLQNHQKRLLEQDSGLVQMFDDQASADLERMYRLFQPVDQGIAQIAGMMKKHIIELGFGFIDSTKEAQQGNKANANQNYDLIMKIIALHDRFHVHVVRDFNKDPVLNRALKDGFEKFINEENFVIRSLARYTNHFMIKGGFAEGKHDIEKDAIMNNIRMIYGYLRDKDVFEREYQHYLAHRLLNNKSSSDQMEQTMVGHLKSESGYHWAKKLEDMFKDMQISKEVMKEFNRERRNNFDFEATVSICEYTKWPANVDQKKLSAINPIDDIERFYLTLREFYEQKHTGRKFYIRWDTGGGEALVTFNKKKNIQKIVVFNSTYQIMVMLLFNKKNPEQKQKKVWNYNQMQQMLGIPDDELKAALIPLIHPKIGILQKKPGGKAIEGDHLFRLKGAMKNPEKRINVPKGQVKKNTNSDENKIPKEIINQRRHQMDAAIVRVMKARRALSVQELLAEVAQCLQSRFHPIPREMKRRIETLISQDYLCREEDDRNMLNYVA